MKKLLLTGFEPFLGNEINPTESIVRELDGVKTEHYEIVGAVLPVDFKETATKLDEWLDKEQPDDVMLLGLAAGRNRITPERIAININDAEADNRGYRPDGERIEEDGPDGYFSTLPIRDMVHDLREQGYPAEISNTAGAYLCNHVMYHFLHRAKEEGWETRGGFVHIPASHELALTHSKLPSWSHRDLRDAVLTMIGTLKR
ncbi:peptidase C15 [Pontibacillus halophilus JSM 076056 = DSM 19796]|uniref:Pyrrolidone-carboxylate peptidase n=1 Tax=Pontibacillus halophilus JSM 076056 = DSM 19796 TaxID=1385510 RepID=A0A0A5GG70_9BACI|nr:pyroglutamyl-peptidase I [Pontibacillus halophilus]KGX92246.1 peptidase C15 [Pontibacillus halophilus JSM 076056 = DSM 19796]